MTDTDLNTMTSEDDAALEGEDHSSSPLRLALLIGAVIALGTLAGLSALIIVLAFVIMIFMHELGHFMTAKAAGMKVTEFFIGFGPRIWSFQKGETEYGIKAIPAGAYVRIIGMNNLDQVDPADESRTYRQKSYPRRMSVALAGSAMHFLMALVFAFVALVGFGEITQNSERNWTIGAVSTAESTLADPPGDLDAEFTELLESGQTPATLAGLAPGDRIVAGDGQELPDYSALQAFIAERPGETVTLTVERDGERFETDTTLGARDVDGETLGYLGIQSELQPERLGFIDGAQQSFATFGEITVESLKGLARFFSPSGLSGFVDTVFHAGDDEPETESSGSGSSASGNEDDNRIISIYGAGHIGTQVVDSDGAAGLLRFMVLLNIFIGVFNLVPLLPLDGGHVAVATYERIREFGSKRRHHADITKLLPLTYAVVLFLVTIGLLALYADIASPVDLQ